MTIVRSASAARLLAAPLLVCAVTACLITPASAHATLETKEAAPGSAYKAIVKIGHGCDGSPTVTLRVTIPEGVIGVKPMPKAGWKLEIVKGTYAAPYSYYGGKKISDGVKEVVWSGGKLTDDTYDEFVLSTYLAPELSASSALYWPVVQECEQGQNRWTEIPATGQDAHALKSPAAGLKLVAAKAAAPAVYKLGTLTIEQPWTRATPHGAKVAGGFLRVTNTGTAADRLVGGNFTGAGIVEVHEMAMENSVMKMRKLEQGIEVKPGETVELKPGGLHMMFIGLVADVKEGHPVRGALQFEKAGTIAVDYAVAPIGGQKAGGDHSQH